MDRFVTDNSQTILRHFHINVYIYVISRYESWNKCSFVTYSLPLCWTQFSKGELNAFTTALTDIYIFLFGSQWLKAFFVVCKGADQAKVLTCHDYHRWKSLVCPITDIFFCILVIGQTCSESNKRNTEALPSATDSLQSYSSPGWRVTYYP